MTEMRFLREDEKESLAQLYNNAFRVGLETARKWAADAGEPRTLVVPEPRRLASVINMLPYEMMFGGRAVPMGGIGGVATWADCQGKGYAGALMHRSVEMMHEQGYMVSALYPFSFRYYRKFGWESCGDRISYEGFRQSDLRRGEDSGLVRAWRGVEDAPLFAAAYQRLAGERFNGLIVRSQDSWPARLTTLEEAGGHAYLIEEDGEVTGYFLCEHPRDAAGHLNLRIRDYATNTPRAMRAMTTFMATLPNNVEMMSLQTPAYPTIFEAFLEPTVRKALSPGFMLRVLDVCGAVAARGYNTAAHKGFTAFITDDHGPWNTGAYEFDFGGGRGEARRLPEGSATDFSWTIQEFSQVFTGYRDMVQLHAAGLFEAPSAGAAAIVRDAFCDRPTHLMDFF